MFFFYRFLAIISTPIVFLWFIFRIFNGKEDKKRILERFGFSKIKRPEGKLVWVHAASVGESMAVLPVIKSLAKKNISLLLTTGTLSSSIVIRPLLPSNVIYQFATVENYFFIKRFLKHWQPNLTIFVESELWPVIISETAKYSQIISLNTSISDRSYKYWQKLSSIRKRMFDSIFLFLPKSARDHQLLCDLSLKNKSLHFGNLKYCTSPLSYDEQKYNEIKKQIKGKKIVLFASTHSAENEFIIKTYHQIPDNLKKEIVFIIAPRHPYKVDLLIEMLKQNNISYVQRSRKQKLGWAADFYLADTIGELGLFYRLAPITLMGGTFCSVGGHNIIEPIRLKSVVITGPQIDGIKEIDNDFYQNGGLIHVKDEKEASTAIEKLLQQKNLREKIQNQAQEILKTKKNLLDKMINVISDAL